MPDRVRWRLLFPSASEDDRNRTRHYQSLFWHDPYVETIDVSDTNADVIEMDVVFGPGLTGPRTPELARMDLRFPRHPAWARGTADPSPYRRTNWDAAKIRDPRPTVWDRLGQDDFDDE